MRRKRVSMAVAGAVVCALAAGALAADGGTTGAGAPDRPRTEEPRIAAGAVGGNLGALLSAAATLPGGQEALAKYTAAVAELEGQLAEMRAKCQQEVRAITGEGAEEATKQVLEKYRAEMLPVIEKLVEARLALCEELMKIAKADPKAVAAATVEGVLQRITRGRPGAGREGAVREGAMPPARGDGER